jgi:RNA polymerase sigma-70 factor (ECF subfamily)
LTRHFGFDQLSTAEDLAQEAWITASSEWRAKGAPDVPAAWLMRVAKNKAYNHVKRQAVDRRARQSEAAFSDEPNEEAEAFFEGEIEDSMLRMIFACCHPALAPAEQLVLILRALAGLEVSEIAAALLASEEAIQKRYSRARTHVVEEKIEFEVPGGDTLQPRLHMVLTSLYLLFNEGYSTAASELPIRRDLCFEALRLGKLVASRFAAEPSPQALVALMFLHAARLASRIDAEGALVVFADQDRSLWDRKLIAAGLHYLAKSATGDSLTRYHLEASIAAQHCLASSFEDTNWPVILELYEALDRQNPSPISKLNLAIVTRYTKGPEAAIEALNQLRNDKKLARYPLLHATLAEFHQQLGHAGQATRAYQRAQALSQAGWQRQLIRSRASKLLALN